MKVFADHHMHTPLCRHATGEPTDYAARANLAAVRAAYADKRRTRLGVAEDVEFDPEAYIIDEDAKLYRDIVDRYGIRLPTAACT